MIIDYDKLFPKILERLFPEEHAREEVLAILSDYGLEEWHAEQSRVKVAILYLSKQNLNDIKDSTSCACVDYRDILGYAEYPLTLRHSRLEKTNPKEYEKLAEQEREQYLEWIQSIVK